jgi:hypothetical protein
MCARLSFPALILHPVRPKVQLQKQKDRSTGPAKRAPPPRPAAIRDPENPNVDVWTGSLRFEHLGSIASVGNVVPVALPKPQRARFSAAGAVDQ